jgi:release factor glutamine methyltransferase
MQTLREVASALDEAGVPSAMHDARVLVAYAAGHEVPLDELVRQRASRVPLQHITGSAGFRYLDLAVGAGVFVPRPETELLVDEVLTVIAGLPRPRVVDLCAGSGAIGLSVAKECAGAVVDLVESSADAMPWLRRNAVEFDNVRLHQADLSLAPDDVDHVVDVVVSNPPYVPLDERELVEPEVRDHDPAAALWAGTDGLDVIRRIVDRASVLLRPGGRLIFEHSDRQGESAPAVVIAAGYIDVADHLDLIGRARYVTASLPC